jgi:hypothetical protein
MKKIIISSLLALSSLYASTAERAHIGIAHDTNSIHLGYDIDTALRVEGYFAYDEDFDKRIDLGVGGFYKTAATENSLFYVGARLGVVDFSTLDGGLLFTPTAGYEYMFNEHVSFGAEAGLAVGTGDLPTQTVTNLTLRYYF